jgi:hypothetical protein
MRELVQHVQPLTCWTSFFIRHQPNCPLHLVFRRRKQTRKLKPFSKSSHAPLAANLYAADKPLSHPNFNKALFTNRWGP